MTSNARLKTRSALSRTNNDSGQSANNYVEVDLKFGLLVLDNLLVKYDRNFEKP